MGSGSKNKNKVSLVRKNLLLTILVLISGYWVLDHLMMNVRENPHMAFIVTFTLAASLILYICYVRDYQKDMGPVGGTDIPKFVKNKRKYTDVGWILITVWGIVLLVGEPFIVPKLFPVLDSKYYQSQIMLMIYIAPVMEEIIFRYLLYDRGLRRKWGWFWGFVVASLIFVICHPVTNLHGLVIYWMPTLLFFLIYNEFGLYGSIVMHMIFNMMAI